MQRWYQNVDPAKVLLVAATRLGNFQWSEPLQHAVVATPGSVSQADEIKMLESFQEKFGLSYPLAILASVAPNIPQTGLLLIAPNGNVVDVLQMELQSLRMINSIVRK